MWQGQLYSRRRRVGENQTRGCLCVSVSLLVYRLKIPPVKNCALHYTVLNTHLYIYAQCTVYVFALFPWGRKFGTNRRVASILTFLYLVTNDAFSDVFQRYWVSRWAYTEMSVYVCVYNGNCKRSVKRAEVVVAGVVCFNLLSRHSIVLYKKKFTRSYLCRYLPWNKYFVLPSGNI